MPQSSGLEWLPTMTSLQGGHLFPPRDERLYAGNPRASGDVQAVPFGEDPITQLAFLLAPYLRAGLGRGGTALSGLRTPAVEPGAIERLPGQLSQKIWQRGFQESFAKPTPAPGSLVKSQTLSPAPQSGATEEELTAFARQLADSPGGIMRRLLQQREQELVEYEARGLNYPVQLNNAVPLLENMPEELLRRVDRSVQAGKTLRQSLKEIVPDLPLKQAMEAGGFRDTQPQSRGMTPKQMQAEDATQKALRAQDQAAYSESEARAGSTPQRVPLYAPLQREMQEAINLGYPMSADELQRLVHLNHMAGGHPALLKGHQALPTKLQKIMDEIIQAHKKMMQWRAERE